MAKKKEEFPGDMYIKINIWTERISYKKMKAYEEQMKRYQREKDKIDEQNESMGAMIHVPDLQEPKQPIPEGKYEPAYLNFSSKIVQLWMPTFDEDEKSETITVDMFDIHGGGLERYLIKMNHEKWIDLIKQIAEIDESYYL